MKKQDYQRHADAMAMAITEALGLACEEGSCKFCGTVDSWHWSTCALAPLIEARGSYRMEEEASSPVDAPRSATAG